MVSVTLNKAIGTDNLGDVSVGEFSITIAALGHSISMSGKEALELIKKLQYAVEQGKSSVMYVVASPTEASDGPVAIYMLDSGTYELPDARMRELVNRPKDAQPTLDELAVSEGWKKIR